MAKKDGSTSWSRRQALGQLASLGVGVFTTFGSRGTVDLHAQFGGVQPVGVPQDPRYPLPPTWEAQVKEVAPAAYAFIQAGGPGRDNASVANAGFIVGDEGVLVIDTLTAPMHARALIAAIRKVTDRPVRHVVLTHHHGDHINGNQYFEGAEIVSHPYCRDEIVSAAAAPGPPFWPKREGWSDGTDPRKIVPPTTTFEGKMTYHYGKNIVELLPMVPAHTYGDVVVYLPQHGVIFLGDIAFFYVAPWCQNAHPSEWISACQRTEKMKVETIVPGHGPLGGKAELADMRGYLELLRTEARKRFDARMSAGAAAADIRLGKYDNWIGPERIVMDTARFYQEFRNQLTPAVDVAGIRQATEEYNSAKKAPTTR